MKALTVVLILFPILAIGQTINTSESKSKSNIYNDAIKQFLVRTHPNERKVDTIFIEKRENFSDSILTKINGTVIQIIDCSEISAKLDLVESFTLHRFLSLEFDQGLFSISVIPFHATKNSTGVNLGNGGGCKMIYTYDNVLKQFKFEKVSCWGG